MELLVPAAEPSWLEASVPRSPSELPASTLLPVPSELLLFSSSERVHDHVRQRSDTCMHAASHDMH
jgi:hypothetical protein